MPPSLAAVTRALRRQHGAPRPLPPRNAFEWVLWENVAYLADDEKRAAAFAQLAKTIGTTPEAILRARNPDLLAVTRHGIVADLFARKLRRAAELARDRFDGDVDPSLSADLAKAAKQLRVFPGVGEPGATKILVATGRLRALPLDSNGLRVMTRIGFGQALKSYSASYRSVQAAIDIGKATPKSLFETHLLLQRHGREICRRSAPECGRCRLLTMCAYGQRVSPSLSPKAKKDLTL